MNIKEKRLTLGLTQIETAKRIGASLNTYQKWEYGVAKPNPENLKKLKEVLQIKED